MKKIAIIDYGMGNVQSVANALEFLGYTATITDDHDLLKASDAYILPGVGAFAEAMNNLRKRHLITLLHTLVIEQNKPILGICLGMQLFMQSSEEMGLHEGLGWIEGKVIAMIPDSILRVPHVGWNDIIAKEDSPLFMGINRDAHFYFDHSYHVVCDEPYISAKCQYGSYELTAALHHKNLFATQFHPEKSQTKGLKLLRNFLNFVEESSC